MSNKVTYKNYNMNQLQMPMDITDDIVKLLRKG